MPPTAEQTKVLELEHSAFREESLERLRIQESLADACFRSLVLVNGGAIIALFTLIGSNAQIAKSAPGPSLGIAFGAFALGLATTVGAIIAGYFMQVKYALVTTYQMWNKECEILGGEQVHNVEVPFKWGVRWGWTAIALVLLALLSFVTGAAFCFLAFVR
jgi:hypothetical protein